MSYTVVSYLGVGERVSGEAPFIGCSLGDPSPIFQRRRTAHLRARAYASVNRRATCAPSRCTSTDRSHTSSRCCFKRAGRMHDACEHARTGEAT